MAELDPALAQFVQLCRTFFFGISDLLQRVLIICADVLLIVFALIALNRDYRHTCDETLQFYGALCIMLCVIDLAWECVRCSLESQLDRLQEDFAPQAAMPAGQVNEGLLGDEDAGLGQSLADLRDPSRGPSSANTATGTLGHGIRKEKALKQKRTSDIQFWSIVFSCFVSIMFSFFSSHDEDCAERAPHLYNYIHTFTYVFIFRLGCSIILMCCRTVKNYEDAANAAGVAARQQGTNMTVF